MDPSTPRRKYIIEQIQLKGFVSFDDVTEFMASGNATRSSSASEMPSSWHLTDQHEFFEKFSLPIRIMGKYFVSAQSETRHKSYQIRESHQSKEKKLIAKAVALLICGAEGLGPLAHRFSALANSIRSFKPDNRKKKQDLLDNRKNALVESVQNAAMNVLSKCKSIRKFEEFFDQWQDLSGDTLLKDLHHNSANTQKRDLKKLLKNYYNKSHRHLIMDSGTTTKAIADTLSEDHFWSGPPFLTVYTNSPRIESALEDSNIEVVGLMGEVRKDTSARTGPWCERSLALLQDLSLDIGIVGTTGLAFDSSGELVGFASDSAPEAATKSRILEMVNIRIICADGEKLARGNSSTFVFAAAHGGAIDILITDYSATTNAKPFLEQLTKSGICVIISGSSEVEDEVFVFV